LSEHAVEPEIEKKEDTTVKNFEFFNLNNYEAPLD